MAQFTSILIALTVLVLKGIYCDVQFQYDSEQCLGQSVEYQCIVTGSQILQWNLLDDEGAVVMGSTVTYTSGGSGGLTDKGMFIFEQLQASPSIISNISFTVQSSINGYTIVCAEDVSNTVNENLIINILNGPPLPPININLYIIGNNMSITWSSPTCASSYSITSNATNSIITTTDTSVGIPLAGLSPGVYCVSVATVDTANETGNYSNQECVTIKVPLPPGYSYTLSAAESMDDAKVTVLLTFNSTANVPMLFAGYIMVLTNDSKQTFKEKSTTNSNQMNVEFTITLERGVNYSIVCFGENILGNGSSVTFNIYVNHSEILPTPSMPLAPKNSPYASFVSSDFASLYSISVSPSPMCNTTEDCLMYDNYCDNPCEDETSSETGNSLDVIIGGVVGGVVIVGAIAAIITAILVFKKKNSGVKPSDEEKNDVVKSANTDATTAQHPSIYGKGPLNEKGISNHPKSTKKESPPKPKPYKGNDGPPSQVSYSSGRRELHYAEMSHHTQSHGADRPGGGGGGGSKFRSPPMQGVTYSDIKHR